MRVEVIAEDGNDIEAVLAQHRDLLAIIGLRAAVRRATSARVCRRSSWQARRAHRLLQQRVLRDIVPKVARTPKRASGRRSRARLVIVKAPPP